MKIILLIAYSYINGIPKVNEELLIKLDSTGDYLKRARNTYNLVGLGNLPMGKDRDRRFGQRNTAYQKALKLAGTLESYERPVKRISE